MKNLLDLAINAALLAGLEILKIYEKDFVYTNKKDGSPLTIADQKSNNIITSKLRKTQLPIISEENKLIPYKIRREWKDLWLIDPLDGTKEFINGNGEFTVNIALISNNNPVLGVVYAPSLDLLYFGMTGNSSFKLKNASSYIKDIKNFSKISQKLPLRKNKKKYNIIYSRSHQSDLTLNYVKKLCLDKPVNFIEIGSSLKLCMIAEGVANLYPRLSPTMEWDTAAGHAICLASGFGVKNYKTKLELKYNKKDLLNPFFLCN